VEIVFADRDEAGRRLAEALTGLAGEDVVVLGLPRGGVPVAAAVAEALRAPLDVIVVRKLGAPSQPELAMGAIGEHGVRVLNESIVQSLAVPPAVLDRVESEQRAELELRVRRFRSGRPGLALSGRTAVIVDDGIATGATARAACLVARELGAARVLLAVPVASPRALDVLERVADQVVCLEAPAWFAAVGQAYDDFSQVTDDEVVALLTRAGAEAATADVGDRSPGSGPSAHGSVPRRR
jgi:predicted phosphoribosyltransferase